MSGHHSPYGRSTDAEKRGFVAAPTWARLRNALEDGGLVILCGAGISAAAPANMPLANALVKRAAEALLSPHHSRLDTASLRPEVFFAYLYRWAPETVLRTITALLEGEAYNAHHHLCAGALRQGCCVVTTNFDRLIESAAAAHEVRFSVALTESGEREAVLFKIHGCIADAASMGLTIDQVGAGLGAARETLLHELLRDRTVLVLGYSGNDQLDILPALITAPYERIVWVEHEYGVAPRPRRTRNRNLRPIPRLHYWRGDTAEVTRALGGEVYTALPRGSQDRAAAPSLEALPDGIKVRATADILMHLNDYEAVIELLGETGIDGLDLEIVYFEARGSISRRTPDWVDQRDALMERLIALAPQERSKFLPTLAKFNARRDRLLLFYAWLCEALETDACSDKHIEAAIENLYELIYNHEFPRAERMYRLIGQALERCPFVLLRARLHQERSFMLWQAYRWGRAKPVVLEDARHAANHAMYLAGPDICNDQFYYWQSAISAAVAEMMRGGYAEAERLLRGARRYFLPLSKNNYLATYYHLAELRRRMGDHEGALRQIATFLSQSRKHGRQVFMGEVLREQGYNLAKTGADRRRVQAAFERSIERFKSQENDAEADYTRALQAALDRGSEAPAGGPFP